MLCGTSVGPKGRYPLNHWERHTRTVLEWLLCYISCPKTIFTSGEATHLFLSFWAKQLCTHTALQRATSVLDAATGRILFHKYHRRPGFGFQNANCVGAGKQEPSRGECCSQRLQPCLWSLLSIPTENARAWWSYLPGKGWHEGNAHHLEDALPHTQASQWLPVTLPGRQTSSVTIRRGLIIELGDFNGTGKFKCGVKYEYS